MATDAAAAAAADPQPIDFKAVPPTVSDLKAAADHAAQCWENLKAAAAVYQATVKALSDSEASYIELVKRFHRPPMVQVVE